MKRNISAVALLVLAAVFMGACHRQAQPKGAAATKAAAKGSQPEFKTLEDRYSYAYGASLAQTFKAEGVKFNVALMAAAMQAVFDGRENTMSAGEIAATIEAYRAVHEKEKEAERAVAAPKKQERRRGFPK
jgi:cytochrome c